MDTTGSKTEITGSEVSELDEEKDALKDLYEGIGACKAAESTAVFISLDAAEIAIRCIEYYIQQMTN